MWPSEPSTHRLESEKDCPAPRAQRPPPPPPPPPSTQSEPLFPIDLIATPNEAGAISPYTELSNESMKDADDKCPLLLFQFTELFDKFDYSAIRHKILTRQMRTSPFLTVLWRIFLHCLPRDSSYWDQQIDASRDNYNELVNKYLLDVRKIREHNGDSKDLNHPLSQEENSLWNQYYVYEELRDNIDQDVKRTCQEIPFFRQQHVLDLLLKVLYIHGRDHEQTLPYRQGMHEILAVVVHLIHMESEIINEYPESNELMKKLYDPRYLAHDAYAIYEKIMEHLQLYYDFKQNSVPQRRGSDKTHQITRRSSLVPFHINTTIKRVNDIFNCLKDHDIVLHQKLVDLGIDPTVYGIRWLRLLFGREIPFESIPTLWTVIFCYDESFKFVNYVFLALLEKIGELFTKLGASEFSCCLQYLMQPNIISDVESIIQIALIFEKIDPRRLLSCFDARQMSNSSTLTDIQKPISPNPYSSRNFLSDLARINSYSSSGRDAEMAISPGKENRQRLEDNIQMQKSCARFIHQFIDRIRRGLRKRDSPVEEEVLIQLAGLEQIANALEGKFILDENTLEALLNYYCKEKPIESTLTETI